MGKTRFKDSGVYGEVLGITDSDGNTTDIVDADKSIGNVVNIVASGTVTGDLVTAKVWESLMDEGVAYAKDYAKESVGDDTLVANPTYNAECFIIVTVTEAFANAGGGAQTKFEIGVDTTGSSDSIMAEAVLEDAPVGFQFSKAFTLDKTADIVNVAATAATETSTGAINVLVIVKEGTE